MKIAVIGAGNVGGALAKAWAEAGHTINIGVRDTNSDNVKQLISSNTNISAESVRVASAGAEIILVSVTVQAIKEVAAQIGDASGKIIIDATNSVFLKPEPYNNCFEALKDITKCQDIVKCFNSTGFENMANPRIGDIGLDMFTAGSSKKAKDIAVSLAKDIGFDECYDFGNDDKVQLLEQFAMCWIDLAIMQKYGRNIAFKVFRR